MKYGELNLGQVEAIVNKLGGMSGVSKFLSGDLVVTETVIPTPAPKSIPPRNVEPVFLPSVTSDGRTGKQFTKSLEKAGYRVGDYAKDVMGKTAFVSTTGVVYKPVVILGQQFEDDERITSKIRKFAKEQKFITPPAELAPLLRETVSDEEIERMGLWALIVMHEPITASDGDPNLLEVNRNDNGRWLDTYWDNPDNVWNRQNGFVFLAPQTFSFLSYFCGKVLFYYLSIPSAKLFAC